MPERRERLRVEDAVWPDPDPVPAPHVSNAVPGRNGDGNSHVGDGVYLSDVSRLDNVSFAAKSDVGPGSLRFSSVARIFFPRACSRTICDGIFRWSEAGVSAAVERLFELSPFHSLELFLERSLDNYIARLLGAPFGGISMCLFYGPLLHFCPIFSHL